MRFGGLLLVLIAAVIVFLPVSAEDDSDFEATAADLALETSFFDTHLQAVVGKPTEFMRMGYAYNPTAEPANFKTKLHKKGDIKSVIIGTVRDDETNTILDGVEYTKSTKGILKIKKHKISINVPVGEIRYFEIHYMMPAPQMTYTTVVNDASKYLGKYTESTSYDIHTYNILSTATLPGVPSEWDYGVYVNDAISGARQNLRHFLVDSDGDGKIDKIGWLTPQLSQADGEAQGNPNPGKPKNFPNYNFQQVRADNPYLPESWVHGERPDIAQDDRDWGYMPFSNDGYGGDNSSLIVRVIGQPHVYSEAMNVSTSIYLNFKYKPNFSIPCLWAVGTEIMYPPGHEYYNVDNPSDTTYMLYLYEDGRTEDFDFTTSSVPDENGWFNITATKTLDLPPNEYRVMRFWVDLGGGSTNCNPGDEFLIDDVIARTG